MAALMALNEPRCVTSGTGDTSALADKPALKA